MEHFGKESVRSFLSAFIALFIIAMLPVPVLGEEAYVKELTGFGTDLIKNPEVPTGTGEEKWAGTYIYFGQHVKNRTGSQGGNEKGTEDSAMRYRVLSNATTEYNKPGDDRKTMLLECDRGLDLNYHNIPAVRDALTSNPNFFKEVPDSSEWDKSELKASLNRRIEAIGGTETDLSFLGLDYDGISNFTPAERKMIVESYKDAPSSSDGRGYTDINGEQRKFTPLKGEMIFLLDAGEATRTSYGYDISGDENSKTRIKDIPVKTVSGQPTQGTHVLWTRTAGPDTANGCTAVVILSNGNMGVLNTNSTLWSAPAFNIDPSSISFVSLVGGEMGKPGAEYKLTLKDSSLSVTPGEFMRAGDVLSVSYSGKSSLCNRLSILFTDKSYTDKDVKVIDYGKLSLIDSTKESGSGTYTLKDSLKGKDLSEYNIYIIPENENDRYHTDYAGDPVSISLMHTVTFDENNGSGNTTKVNTNTQGKLDALPEDPKREGYIFAGWFTGITGGEKITLDTVFNSDATVYAHWTFDPKEAEKYLEVDLPGMGADGRSLTIKLKYPSGRVSYNGLSHIENGGKASKKKIADLNIGVTGLPDTVKFKYIFKNNKLAAENKAYYYIKLSIDKKSESYKALDKPGKKRLKTNVKSSNKLLKKAESRVCFEIFKLDLKDFTQDKSAGSAKEMIFVRKDGSGDTLSLKGKKFNKLTGTFGGKKVKLSKKDFTSVVSGETVTVKGRDKNITGEMTGTK